MTEGEFQKQLKKYHKTGEMPVGLAVKLLTECTTDCMYEEETEEAIFMAIQALEQEPKTGRWKPNFRYGMYPNEEHFICSECNGQSMRQLKYCPECGAKMVEPQESEDKE